MGVLAAGSATSACLPQGQSGVVVSVLNAALPITQREDSLIMKGL